jgi:hypothetical protein
MALFLRIEHNGFAVMDLSIGFRSVSVAPRDMALSIDAQELGSDILSISDITAPIDAPELGGDILSISDITAPRTLPPRLVTIAV